MTPACRTTNRHWHDAALKPRDSRLIRFDPESEGVAAPPGKRGRWADATDAAIQAGLAPQGAWGL